MNAYQLLNEIFVIIAFKLNAQIFSIKKSLFHSSLVFLAKIRANSEQIMLFICIYQLNYHLFVFFLVHANQQNKEIPANKKMEHFMCPLRTKQHHKQLNTKKLHKQKEFLAQAIIHSGFKNINDLLIASVKRFVVTNFKRNTALKMKSEPKIVRGSLGVNFSHPFWRILCDIYR